MSSKELNFDIFIKNINLKQITNEIVLLTKALIEYDNKKNVKVVATLGSLSKVLNRLNTIYSNTELVSNSEKKNSLTKLIVTHQELLNLQAIFVDKDKTIETILAKSAAVLTPFYPLFLINEVFEAKQSKLN